MFAQQPHSVACPAEQFLKVPLSILSRSDLAQGEKLLLARIWRWGLNGCFESNKTLAALLGVGPHQVTLYTAKLKQAGCLAWRYEPDGNRTLWAVDHPDFRHAIHVPYCGTEIIKSALHFAPDANCPPVHGCIGGMYKDVQGPSTSSSRAPVHGCTPNRIGSRRRTDKREEKRREDKSKEAPASSARKKQVPASGGVGGTDSKDKGKQAKQAKQAKPKDRGQRTETSPSPSPESGNLPKSDPATPTATATSTGKEAGKLKLPKADRGRPESAPRTLRGHAGSSAPPRPVIRRNKDPQRIEIPPRVKAELAAIQKKWKAGK